MKGSFPIAAALAVLLALPAPPTGAGSLLHRTPGTVIGTHRTPVVEGTRPRRPVRPAPHRGGRKGLRRARPGLYGFPVIVERGAPEVIVIPGPPTPRPRPVRPRPAMAPAEPRRLRVGVGRGARHGVTLLAEAGSAADAARTLAGRRDRLFGALDAAGLDWCLAEAGDPTIALDAGGGFEGRLRVVLATPDAATLFAALDSRAPGAIGRVERADAAPAPERRDGPVTRRPAAAERACPRLG
ncbi:MAG: hypothetical protein ACFBWO_04510 [Paracoccaceae bacterium]